MINCKSYQTSSENTSTLSDLYKTRVDDIIEEKLKKDKEYQEARKSACMEYQQDTDR